MADSKLKIIVDAQDNASGKLRGIGDEVQSLGKGVSQVLSGPSGLGNLGAIFGRFAGPAALGGAVVMVGKAAIGLETMREESAQLEARFTGLTGGTAQARIAMQAFDQVLGNALTRDEKMATAAQVLGLGLAQTATEAATLTQQALILGVDMDTLTQALETGRVNGLVKYGISVGEVAQRAGELQRANASLTDAEAKSLAVKEQLAQKSGEVAAAGGKAATTVKQLTNAWETLVDAAADKVHFEIVLEKTADVLTAGTLYLTEDNSQKAALAQQIFSGEYERMDQLRLALADAQAELTMAEASGADAAMRNAQAHVQQAQAAYDAAQAQNALVQSSLAAAFAAGAVDDGERAYKQAMEATIPTVYEAVAALDKLAAAKARIAGATALLDAGWNPSNMGAYALAMRGDTQAAAGQRWDAEQKRRAAEAVRQNDQVAQRAGTSYASAMQAAASKVGGYIDTAISQSKGLLDLTGQQGLFEPGGNGPFENIFRAAAIAKGGIEGPEEEGWAKNLGLTPETAAKAVADFQNGLLTQEVTALVDKNALVAEVKRQQMAGALKEAFVSEIAAQAGVGKSAVQAVLEPTAAQMTSAKGQVQALASDVAADFKNQGALFATVGGDWMGQLAAGIRGQLPALTAAGAEVVAAFLSAMQGVVANGRPAAPAAANGLPAAPAAAANGRPAAAAAAGRGSGGPASLTVQFLAPVNQRETELGVLRALRQAGIN